MWSIRTAAKCATVRTSTLQSATVGAFCANLEHPNNNTGEKHYSTCHPISVIDHPKRTSGSATPPFSSSTIFFHSKNLSSLIDTNSTDKESKGLEGYSDLDSNTEEKDDEEENTLEGEEELIENSSVSKRYESPLFGLIWSSPRHNMEESLEKWVKEGNEIREEEVIRAVWRLSRWKLFVKALQFMEWLEKSAHYKFTDVEYSSLVGLYAKVHGLYQAEKFIEKIPQSMCTELVYRGLFASCVSEMNVPKAEQIFKKMRDLNFPLSVFTCTQLLLLYKRTDKKKIADVLLMMEKENVKPALFTYKVLIDAKGIVGDIPAMEQLLDTMKEDGIEPDIYIKYLVAKYYIKGGLTEKAEKIAKEMEVGDKNTARKFVLNLYAELGMPDDVDRVWKACGSKSTVEESTTVMLAWAKLGKVENAEKVFDGMSKRFNKVPLRCYNSLLKIYTEKKMLDKAKELVKRMSDEGIAVGPVALNALVRLYVKDGDVAKADSMLQNWVQKNHKMQIKPMCHTYMVLLEAYAKKGDYHNAEKVFHLARQIGYFGRPRMYELVLSAYVKAKVPAYGFRERLKADKIFPGKFLTEQLAAANPFKKAPVTQVLV